MSGMILHDDHKTGEVIGEIENKNDNTATKPIDQQNQKQE